MNETTARAFAPVVLRFGLAILYVWFGLSEMREVASWTSWVPAWATGLTHMSASTIVLFNGMFEFVAGALLALGVLVRPISLLLALHMALIVFDIGLDQIGMRDLAICAATLALCLGGPDWLTIDTTYRKVGTLKGL